jgi:hypothetical protein
MGLAGCAGRLGGYATTLEREVKAANDVAADLLEEAPCAMTLGAWGRMENQVKRDANFIGCVVDHERYGLSISR